MSGKLFRRGLLPALLLATVALGLGSYFETNDDAAIVQLLQGTMAAAPVPDLHLYFHGFGAGLAWLYQVVPCWPWYALLLYGLLYAATAGAFTVLDRLLEGRVPASGAAVLLALFFLTAWLEHGFWFNYVRVPILLSGVGVLLAAQRPGRQMALWLGLLAFAVSWLIRPSAALLGLLAAAPGAWWLSGRRAWPVLGGAAAWAVLGAVVLHLSDSPEAAAFRRLDVLKSRLLDFQLASPPNRPLAPPDSVGLAAAHRWLLADSTLINEAFFDRAAPLPPPAYFLVHLAPAKLAQTVPMLLRDYFPLLLLLLVTAALAGGRAGSGRAFLCAQLFYAGLVLGLAAVLKLPPRLALPLLDLWVLSNLAYVFRAGEPVPRWAGRAMLAALVLAAVPYTYKTLHRRTVLAQERQHNRRERHRLARLLQPMAAGGPVRLVVSDAAEATYKAASPFCEEGLLLDSQCQTRLTGPRYLPIAGWLALHPAQAAWRQQLTGTRHLPESLRRLAARPDVAWILTPGTAAILNWQLARLAGPPMQLELVQPHEGASQAAQAYRPHQ